ncbi:zinc-dependent alcohol dehydrogenase [Zavarzinia aquatilis]|uniref:Dehydrogenase n=1 Tax=Zavarzinia aquatilis TaxID=2211142 RepID=A0A317EDC9_9PROT|nr:alcohol dehydrogenase catalytic domain-containing protein [Zavarzinia aquatilis]PWR24150.1 dehydrogenase [Zavarzinia aquatilis]
MRELVYIGDRKVEWRERPDPRIESRYDAIVKPVAATTCDVDKSIIGGRAPTPPPFAIGHECVAEVVETGPGVTHVGPGDLVVVPWHISCGRCDRCRAGLTAHCRQVPRLAMFGAPIGGDWGGLFSDLVRVPYADTMLVPLPAGLDPIAMASASDNFSLAWRLVAPHLQRKPGATVLILSRGSIGLYVCDIARALGASRRLYVDPDAGRRAIAESYGAETAEAIEAGQQVFDIAIESTGNTKHLATACCCLEPEGMCESAGNHFITGELPLFQMYLNAVNLRVGRDNVRVNIPHALDLAQSGRVDPRRIVSHVLDWETLPEELPKLHTKPVFVRGSVLV